MYIQMCLVQQPMQQRHQNYRVITSPKGLQKRDHQVITPPWSPKCIIQFLWTPPLDRLISTPISISHTPQGPAKHIIIVPRGVTLGDSAIKTLMIGRILNRW